MKSLFKDKSEAIEFVKLMNKQNSNFCYINSNKKYILSKKVIANLDGIISYFRYTIYYR